MSLVKLLMIGYLITGLIPVVRFRSHKFFNFLLIQSLLNPVVIILLHVFKIILDPLIYLQLMVLIMFLSFPLVNSRIKIITTIPIIISIYHIEHNTLFILFICIGVEASLIYYMMYNFYKEIKIEGKGSLYLLFLSLIALIDGLKAFIYIENIGLFASLAVIFLMVNIILLILLATFGVATKTKIPLCCSKWFDYKVDEYILELPRSEGLSLYQTIGKNNQYYLTERECEILELIAQGLTSRIIAKELFLSKRTVDHHRATIKAKLEFSDAKQVSIFLEKLKHSSSNNNHVD